MKRSLGWLIEWEAYKKGPGEAKRLAREKERHMNTAKERRCSVKYESMSP